MANSAEVSRRIDLTCLSPAVFANQLSTALSRLTQHVELHRRADLIVLGSQLLQLCSRSVFLDPSLPPDAGGAETVILPAAPVEAAAMRAVADWLKAQRC